MAPESSRRLFLLRVGALVLPVVSARQASRPATALPNIIVIMADDLGYGDIGCFGAADIATPAIDRIAQEGVRLTDYYTCCPACGPSRASLLTGRYPVRSGMIQNLFPDSPSGLPTDETTIAEAVKLAGYATCCIGKWHLGDLPEYRPLNHGFDHYYGLLYSNDMANPRLYSDDRVIQDPAEQPSLTERYTQEAIRWIRANGDRPFFLYLPHTMPHVPLSVTPHFAGRSKRGLYGDVVQALDWSVGEIMNALRQLALEERTLVCFNSDNGPWLAKREHGGSAGRLRDGKGTAYEGGVRLPFVARLPGVIPAGIVCREPVLNIDLFPTIAGLADTPVSELDGKDVLPLLTGKSKAPERPLYFYRNGRVLAIRRGKWKLHLRQKRGNTIIDRAIPELYDLSTDPAESINLSTAYPKVIADLRDEVDEWEAKTRVREGEVRVGAAGRKS